jgi:flagellar FliJ protein
MKFSFRFERVLTIRRYEEDKIKNQLALLQNELHNERQKLKDLYLELEENNKKLTDSLRGNIDINLMNSYRYHIERIIEKLDVQKKIIYQISEEIKVKRVQLMKAMQKVKVLEILREKKLKEHLKFLEYKEEETLDEIGTQQYIKKIKGKII